MSEAIRTVSNPIKIIAPFGYDFMTLPQTKIIMQDERYNKNAGIPRYSKHIHLKLIIGFQSGGRPIAICGSCNFTKNSINNMHELLIIITETEVISKLEQVFDKIWSRLPERGLNHGFNPKAVAESVL